MLVCTRFGLRVREREWLEHRLELLSAITILSLLAQHDQAFRWVLWVDGSLPTDLRNELEQRLDVFEGRAVLDERWFHRPESLVEVGRGLGLEDAHPHLLTARIDDDDAWCRETVGEARSRVRSWLNRTDRAPGLSLTFQDGLEWVMHDMIDVTTLDGPEGPTVQPAGAWHYRFPFIGMSVFVCSPFSEEGTSMSQAHPRVGEHLAASRGFATEIVSSEAPMWLYCRHKQAGTCLRKAEGEEADFSIEELAERFGLDEAAVSKYIAGADRYQYAIVQGLNFKKRQLLVERHHIVQRLDDPAISTQDREALLRRRDEVTAEVDDLECNVLGRPAQAPSGD